MMKDMLPSVTIRSIYNSKENINVILGPKGLRHLTQIQPQFNSVFFFFFFQQRKRRTTATFLEQNPLKKTKRL